MKRTLLLALTLLSAALAAACGAEEAAQPTNTSQPSSPTQPSGTPQPGIATPTMSTGEARMLQPGDSPRAPVGALDTSKSYTATFKTEKGDFTVELFDDDAPLTVENFINLARIGYYDDTTFHRVLKEPQSVPRPFMAQGGDPTGTGGGDPGYRFRDEFSPNRRHDSAGILSMANSGPNTNGSQFFITYGPTPHLDGYDANGNLKPCGQPRVSCHAVFGKVTEGMDVVESLRQRDPNIPSEAATPGDKLITIEITES